MHALKFALAIALATVTATLLARAPLAAAYPGPAHDRFASARLTAVRIATARYHSLDIAEADGYALLKDAAGIACIANPGVGAMGVHYVKGALVAAGKVDALRPQALVYEPTENGTLHLVAVEYVVFQQAWDASHSARPTLFGQTFMFTPAGNRYGLPAFYSLHAWIWKSNPSGMFSMWNPRVHCDTARREGADD